MIINFGSKWLGYKGPCSNSEQLYDNNLQILLPVGVEER